MLGKVLDLLKPHRQGGQRRAQLVRGVRGELPLGGDAPGHAVRGSHELLVDEVDLLYSGFLHARARLAGADLLRGRGEVDERRGYFPRLPARQSDGHKE